MISRSASTAPHGWIETTIGDVVVAGVDQGGPAGGSVFTYVDISSVDNRLKRITDAKTLDVLNTPSRARQRLCSNDVLVSMTRPNLNAVAVVPPALDGSIGSTGFDVLRVEGIEPAWLYYLCQTSEFVGAMSLVVQGALYPAVRPKDIRRHVIPLAPLPEQRRIVAAIEQQFTRLDAGVAALKRSQARLKRYRASVLKAAVEGELTAEWRAAHPATETGAELLRRILVERRARWEADLRAKGKDPAKARYEEPTGPDVAGLPAPPEGWCWATIASLVGEFMNNGISVKGADVPPGIPALRLSAMSDSGFDYDDHRYIPVDDHTAAALAIQNGDFYVARGNGSLHLVGRGTLAQEPPAQIVFPDTMIRLRFPDLGELRRFVSVVWPSSHMRRQIERTARTTAGIYKISQHDIEGFVVPLPPLAEQAQVVAEVERRLSVVTALETAIGANLKRAERLRQSILREAFAGRLVPQDPSDEPACALLEHIREERRTSTPRSRRGRVTPQHISLLAASQLP